MAMKRVDPVQAREAYAAGHLVLRDWLAALPAEVWQRPSTLPGWSVSDLAAHLALVADSIAAVAPAEPGTRPLTIAAYVTRYADAAESIAELTRKATGGTERTADQLYSALDESYVAALAAVDALGPGDPVVRAGRGPMHLGDFLATRVVELAVHADDLARSVPEVSAPALGRDAERLAVRVLLDVLAERAPGRSVEVRVAPYAAVQCVEGPRHTRGTPPAVVEAEPAVWVRLASGRARWDEAVAGGEVRASGQRADLAPYLPVL